MPELKQMTCDVYLPEAQSSELREALFQYLEASMGDMQVRCDSRPGAPDELGVIEVVAVAGVVVNSLSLLVNVFKIVRDWQQARKRERGEILLVRIENNECRIDVSLK